MGIRLSCICHLLSMNTSSENTVLLLLCKRKTQEKQHIKIKYHYNFKCNRIYKCLFSSPIRKPKQPLTAGCKPATLDQQKESAEREIDAGKYFNTLISNYQLHQNLPKGNMSIFTTSAEPVKVYSIWHHLRHRSQPDEQSPRPKVQRN